MCISWTIKCWLLLMHGVTMKYIGAMFLFVLGPEPQHWDTGSKWPVSVCPHCVCLCTTSSEDPCFAGTVWPDWLECCRWRCPLGGDGTCHLETTSQTVYERSCLSGQGFFMSKPLLFVTNIAGVCYMPFMYDISHCPSETFCVVIVL